MIHCWALSSFETFKKIMNVFVLFTSHCLKHVITLQMMTRLLRVWVQDINWSQAYHSRWMLIKKWVCLLRWCNGLWFDTITQSSYKWDVGNCESNHMCIEPYCHNMCHEPITRSMVIIDFLITCINLTLTMKVEMEWMNYFYFLKVYLLEKYKSLGSYSLC